MSDFLPGFTLSNIGRDQRGRQRFLVSGPCFCCGQPVKNLRSRGWLRCEIEARIQGGLFRCQNCDQLKGGLPWLRV